MEEALVIDDITNYKKLDKGCEGIIYEYNEDIVFKTFDFSKDLIKQEKFKKIELLKKIEDPSCAFPKNFVLDKNGDKIGYTMNRVKKLNGFYDIGGLNYEADKAKVINYLKALNEAIIRNHSRNILHGDFTNNNFLVDQNYKPILVDTDAFAIGEYELNKKIMVLKYYKMIFGKNCSKIDNEIFTSSLMMMQCFLNGELIKFGDSSEYFKRVINIFNFTEETKEILYHIFSDSINKPYFSEALDLMSEEHLSYKKEDVYKIKRYK